MLSVVVVVAVIAAAAEGAGPNLMGWAAIISAVGGSFAAVTTAIVLAITRRTDRRVTEIDRAVNGQPPGTKPMVSQVQDLHAQIPAPMTPGELDQQALLPLVRRLVVLAEADATRQPDPDD